MMEGSGSTNASIAAHSPLVSVIVPTHNYGRYIGETLESLLAQTHRNWECIVVDDGSTDNTADLVGKLAATDPRVRYVYQANRGQSAARNTGLAAIAGEYVQFLDADDRIESRKFEQQIRYLEQHREVDIVYGSMKYFKHGLTELRYSTAETDKPWMPEVSGTGKEILAALVAGNIMVIHSPLLRRQVIDLVGSFHECMLNEDWDYWIRCAVNGRRFQFEDLPGTLALVRIHPESSSQNRSQMYRYSLLLRKRISATIDDDELLELNRTLTVPIAAWIREEDIRNALEHVRNGLWPRAIWEFIKIGSRSQSYREMVKWFFCALVAPFAPRDDFQTIVTSPVVKSIVKIVRCRFGGHRTDT